MKEQEIVDIVFRMNNEIYEVTNDEEAYHLDILTDGYATVIKFLGRVIWSSENEEREWIEIKNDYEPLEPFLKKIINKEIEKLQKQVFKIKKNPKIHKVMEWGSSDTVCGVKMPKNTSMQDELVTCKECLSKGKKKTAEKVVEFRGRKK